MKLALLLLAGLTLTPCFGSEHESHASDDNADAVATFLSEFSNVLALGDLSELNANAMKVVQEGFRFCTWKEVDWKDQLLGLHMSPGRCLVMHSYYIRKLRSNPDLVWIQLCEEMASELYLDGVPERCEKYLEINKRAQSRAS